MRADQATSSTSELQRRPDPYVAYLNRFFRKWLPVYDGFARSIFWAYRSAVGCVAPAPGSRVLDICTGTGEIALRCARRGADVTGIDITPDMLAKARLKAHRSPTTRDIVFDIADARSLPFPDCSFDVAVLGFALHDMPRKVRVQVLQEAVRVARDRVVILDYDIPQRALGRLAATLISKFETVYFPGFAREGVSPLLEELGPVTKSSAARSRTRRIFPGTFAIFELSV